MTVSAGTWPKLYNLNGQLVNIIEDCFDANIQDALLTDQAGQEILDFSLSALDPNAYGIFNEMLVGFGGSMFRVRIPLATVDDKGASIFKFHCEALWYDLGAAPPVVISNPTSDPHAALTTILAGTGWTVGTVNPTSGTAFSVAAPGISPLAAIRQLPAYFGGEVAFDNVNRTVSLLTQRGNPNSQILYARAHNLSSDSIQSDSTGMASRIYPYGANNIDITSVNGGVPYLEDYTFYDSRGWPRQVKAEIVNNDSMVTPAALKAWAQGLLKALNGPATTYNVAVTALPDDVQPNLGDTVIVWDKQLNVRANTRVSARSLWPLEPRKNVYTLDTVAHRLINSITQPTPLSQQATTDPLPPAAPQLPADPVVINAAFDAQGNRVLTATIAWDAVTTNQDGSTLLDFDHYEVQYQIDGGSWTPLGNTTDTAVNTGPIAVGSAVVARVAAVDHAGNFSGWTDTASTPAAADNVAPSTPTAPTVSGSYIPLSIAVTWDGNDTTGHLITQGAPDFNYLEVHMVSAATAANGFGTGTGQVQPSSATLIDTITSPLGGMSVAPNLAPGTYFFAFVAVDLSNNRSPISAQASASPSSFDAAHMANYFANAAIGDAQIGSLSVAKLVAGTMTAVVTISGRIATATAGQRAEMNASGFQGFNGSGLNTVALKNDGTMLIQNPLGPTFQTDANGNTTFAGNILAGSTMPQSVYNQNHVVNSGLEDTDPISNGVAGWSYHLNGTAYNAQYQASPPQWSATTAYAANIEVMHNGFVWWSTFTAPPVGAEPGTTTAWQQISFGIGTLQSSGTNWTAQQSTGFSSPAVTPITGRRSFAIRTTDTSSGANVLSNLINCAPGENWHVRLDAQMIGAFRRFFVRIYFYDSAGNPSQTTPPAGTVSNAQILSQGGAFVSAPATGQGAYLAATSTAPAFPASADIVGGYTPTNQNVMRCTGNVLIPANVYGFRIAVYNWTGAAVGTSTLVFDNGMAVRALDGHSMQNGVITGGIIQTALTGARAILTSGLTLPGSSTNPVRGLIAVGNPMSSNPMFASTDYNDNNNNNVTAGIITGGVRTSTDSTSENMIIVYPRNSVDDTYTSATRDPRMLRRGVVAQVYDGTTSDYVSLSVQNTIPVVGAYLSNCAVGFLPAPLVQSAVFGQNTTWVNFKCLGLTQTSVAGTKRNITDVEPGWALRALRHARPKVWQYKSEAEGGIAPVSYADDWHIGPMHEDLPHHVLASDTDLDLRDLLGLVMAAVDDLAEFVGAPKGAKPRRTPTDGGKGSLMSLDERARIFQEYHKDSHVQPHQPEAGEWHWDPTTEPRSPELDLTRR